MPVCKGDIVSIEYEGSFEDGTIFESSKSDGKPLGFRVGSGQMIKGIDEAVVGMERGEEKSLRLEPKDAYGEHNPEGIREAPIQPGQNMEVLKPGMGFIIKLPDGSLAPLKIVENDGKTLKLDLNHPLAGKVLFFKIKVLDYSKEEKPETGDDPCPAETTAPSQSTKPNESPKKA